MKTLVLLHGWGVRPTVFDGLRALLEPHFDTCAPPLPGYDGAPSSKPYDLEGVAAQVAATSPERCLVVGWSLGGQIALAWAERAPQQVERVAFISTTPSFVQREQWEPALEPRVLREFASALASDVDRTLARFSVLQARGDAQSRAVISGLRNALASTATTDVAALRDGLLILSESDSRERVKAIGQPALVVHGEHDALVPTAAAEWFAHALPNGRLECVRNAAHAPFLSRPESVGAALREFFA